MCDAFDRALFGSTHALRATHTLASRACVFVLRGSQPTSSPPSPLPQSMSSTFYNNRLQTLNTWPFILHTRPFILSTQPLILSQVTVSVDGVSCGTMFFVGHRRVSRHKLFDARNTLPQII